MGKYQNQFVHLHYLCTTIHAYQYYQWKPKTLWNTLYKTLEIITKVRRNIQRFINSQTTKGKMNV